MAESSPGPTHAARPASVIGREPIPTSDVGDLASVWRHGGLPPWAQHSLPPTSTPPDADYRYAEPAASRRGIGGGAQSEDGRCARKFQLGSTDFGAVVRPAVDPRANPAQDPRLILE